MAKKWSEVVTSEGFMSLSPEQQAEAQRQYFDTVVAPQANEQGFNLAEVEQQFFTENALQPTGEQVEQETQDVVLPEPPQDLSGQTLVEQPVPSADWSPLPSHTDTSAWGDTLQEGPKERKAREREEARQARRQAREARRRERLGMDSKGTTAYQRAVKASQDAWSDVPTNFDATDPYVEQARANWGAVAQPFKEPAPQQRGQGQMDAEALKAMYGGEPSVWDKLDPEVAAANVPVAPEDGASLLDAVYTEKARLMDEGYDDATAEKMAFEKAQRDSLQFAATAIPVAGLASLPARMAIAGAVNTGAGAVADVAADKELTKGQMAEDFFWGSLGGIGGQAGKGTAKKAIGAKADDLKVLKDDAIQELDDLAKQAKAKESIAASTSSTKPMRETLEGTTSITADDMVDAKNVATTLQTLNKAGAKTSVSDILKTVKNDELRDILRRAAPLKTTVDTVNEKVSSVVGEEVGELLGLGSGSTKKANREAISEVAHGMEEALQWSKESLGIVGNYQGATKQSFDKVFKSLEKTQQLITNGKFAEAKRELAKTDNKKAAFQKLFGSTTAGEVQRIKKELLSLVEVGQSSRGHAKPDNLLGKIRGMGIPTISAYIQNPLLGAGVSVGKGLANFATSKVSAKKLADVEKALGGKLKVDAKAEQMLADGADVGDVVGYLVAKMLRED